MIKNDLLRKLSVITALVTGTISALISLIYCFTNARSLFAGDFLVYSIPALGFFDLFFLFVTYSSIVAFIVISYLHFLKKKLFSATIYNILAVGFFLVSLIYIATNKLWPNNGLEGILVFVNKVMLLLTNIALVGTVITE